MAVVIPAGPLLGLLGLALTVHRLVALLGRGGHSQAIRYAAAAVGIAVVAYPVGALIGAWALCAPADAGNLCGIGGAIGTGPFAAGIALAAYSRRAAHG